MSGAAQLDIEYVRTRSDEETGDPFEFTVDATLEDGQASITIGDLDFRIDLTTGSTTWCPHRSTNYGDLAIIEHRHALT